MSRAPEHAALQPALAAALARRAPGAIALYGIGMRARDLLAELSDFPVVGLLDKDPANLGKVYFGQPVLAPDEAIARGVRTIVIAATDVYWHTIARRIAPWCEAAGIAVLFPDGTPADTAVAPITPLAPCADRAALEAAIDAHAVVSFDLFETLVTRQAIRPDDILEQAAARAQADCGIDAARLIAARKAAEARCNAEAAQHSYPLARLYDTMKTCAELPAAAVDALHAAELDTEIALCRPRPAMLACLRDCRARGKTVWITTDTLLPREALLALLARCGLTDAPPLLISAEQGLSKAHGGLFDLLRSRHPRAAILHIGDHPVSDVDQARRHGLAACRIPAPAEVLRATALGAWEVEARSADDGRLLGLLAAQLFDDPFARPGNAPVAIDSLHRFGYLFFGPLLLAYLAWLIAQLRKRPVDHLLFFAREGHLLVHLYETLRTRLGDTTLPAGTYFTTSRRMATVAALRTPADVHALMDDAFTGSSSQWLRLRFGLEATDVADDDAIDNTHPAARALVDAHMDAILANAAAERAGYHAYIAAQGIDTDAPIAVADLGLKGTIQHALERLLARPMDGYYITGRFGEHNPFGMTDHTRALFEQAPQRPPDAVYRYHILCESVLVAPHGMAVRADAEGRPHYAPQQSNQRQFAHKRAIHAGIEALFDDWFDGGNALPERLSPGLIDAVFATAMSPAVRIDDAVKASFHVDEAYRAETERHLWD